MAVDPEKTTQEETARAMAETTNIPEKRKLTREEIIERKMSLARERGSRVLRINSPLGNIMFNVLRQFDMAYGNLKGQLGEPGGISYEECSRFMDEAREITYAFSRLTKKLSRKVHHRYFIPQELNEVLKEPDDGQ